jgi:hypothetical protein
MSFTDPFPSFANASFGHSLGLSCFLATIARLTKPGLDHMPEGNGREAFAAVNTLAKAVDVVGSLIEQAIQAHEVGRVFNIIIDMADPRNNRHELGDPCPSRGCHLVHVRLIWTTPDRPSKLIALYDLPGEIVDYEAVWDRNIHRYTRIPGDAPEWLNRIVPGTVSTTYKDLYGRQLPPTFQGRLNEEDFEGPHLRMVRRREMAWAASLSNSALMAHCEVTKEILERLEQTSPSRVPINYLDICLWEWKARDEAIHVKRNIRANLLMRKARQFYQTPDEIGTSRRTIQAIRGGVPAPRGQIHRSTPYRPIRPAPSQVNRVAPITIPTVDPRSPRPPTVRAPLQTLPNGVSIRPRTSAQPPADTTPVRPPTPHPRTGSFLNSLMALAEAADQDRARMQQSGSRSAPPTVRSPTSLGSPPPLQPDSGSSSPDENEPPSSGRSERSSPTLVERI